MAELFEMGIREIQAGLMSGEFSAREAFGGTSYEQTGPVYSGLFKDNTARIRYKQSGSAISWWLRSAYSTLRFRIVGNGGTIASNTNADNAFGVVIGFCI